MATTPKEAEIEHLLAFVASSGCTFHRNGRDYDPASAADHLRLKLSRGGHYVNNADQFIDRLASESSWSGKEYTVTCNGQTSTSRQWLQRALAAFRATPGKD